MNLIPAPASLVPASRGADATSGLYFYGYRYYDPVTGRWPSRDPIGGRGGKNLYGFLGNDAIDSNDFLGLEPTIPLDIGPSLNLTDLPAPSLWPDRPIETPKSSVDLYESTDLDQISFTIDFKGDCKADYLYEFTGDSSSCTGSLIATLNFTAIVKGGATNSEMNGVVTGRYPMIIAPLQEPAKGKDMRTDAAKSQLSFSWELGKLECCNGILKETLAIYSKLMPSRDSVITPKAEARLDIWIELEGCAKVKESKVEMTGLNKDWVDYKKK